MIQQPSINRWTTRRKFPLIMNLYINLAQNLAQKLMRKYLIKISLGIMYIFFRDFQNFPNEAQTSSDNLGQLFDLVILAKISLTI